MKRLRSLLACTLVLGVWGCSDDTEPERDTQVPTEQGVDLGTDGTPADLGQDQAPADVAVDQQADTPPVESDQGVDVPVVTDLPPGGSDPTKCSQAPRVQLVNGAVLIKGDTTDVDDEFSELLCSGSSSYNQLDGAQVYYRFRGTKDQWYRFTLKSTFTAYFYVFTDPRCTEASIEGDCTSEGDTGTTSNSVVEKRNEAIYFKAPADGDIWVAVDSSSFLEEGPFELLIEEFYPPTNGTCDKALEMVFFNGVARARTDIFSGFTPDEFPNVACGSTYSTYDGPQAYFRFEGKEGLAYKIKLRSESGDTTNSFYFYVFGDTCTEKAIDDACASDGKSGVISTLGVGSTAERSIVFSPPADGKYTVAVDSKSDGARGAVELEVRPFTPQTNSSCDKAELVTLVDGKGTIKGDTLGLPNEYGTDIDCGLSYTELEGSQAYYELNLEDGKYYALRVKPNFSTYIYLFPKAACGSPAAINHACEGNDGALFGSIYSGEEEVFLFKPAKAGSYILVVDSSTPSAMGTFEIDISDGIAPSNDTCIKAEKLTFQNGVAQVTASTLGAANENGDHIDCGSYTELDGPQVYYSFEVKAGAGYRINMTPKDSIAYYYIFAANSCGSVAGINADCDSSGRDGLFSQLVPKNGKAERLFKPRNTGTYIIAVDTSSGAAAGAFDLKVEELNAPANAKCDDATLVTLKSDETTVVKGSTAFGDDEFQVSCGSAKFFDGPQTYYSFDAKAGMSYWFQLSPSFDNAYLYLFDGACEQANIESVCSGKSGDGGVVGPVGKGQAFYFTPDKSGRYTFAVDSNLSSSLDEFGDFVLNIEEFTTAGNDTCDKAKEITLTDGQGKAVGFSVGSKDEFPGLIKCGGTDAFAAGQIYYKVQLKAGIEYALRVITDFNAIAYAFTDAAGCAAASIEQECAKTGALKLLAGQLQSILITPTADATYYLVVDGEDPTKHQGRHQVEVSSFEPPTLVAPFRLDFEQNNGGLGSTGDWEWGKLAWTGVGATACEASNPPPGDVGHVPTQSGMWGTVLNACHNNLSDKVPARADCENDQPELNSRLAFWLDLSQSTCASATSITLDYWSYVALYSLYDLAEVRIDGKPDPASQVCSAAANSKKWEQKSLDVSAHAGKKVLVTFNFGTNSIYNDAGWYIDELEVICQ